MRAFAAKPLQPNFYSETLEAMPAIQSDLFGYILAWTSLLPIFIFVSIGTLVLFRRDLHTICFGLGILLNELLNKALKRLIKEPRPSILGRELINSYGKPSDHSQYMAFFTVYVILFLCIRAHRVGTFIDNLWKVVIGLLVVCASSLCCYSRVYLKYHTPMQVYWGVVIGFISGVFWFFIVHIVLTPFFPRITSWRISEFLMLRDYSLIPNTLWFEYCQVRTEARARMRKQNSRSS